MDPAHGLPDQLKYNPLGPSEARSTALAGVACIAAIGRGTQRRFHAPSGGARRRGSQAMTAASSHALAAEITPNSPQASPFRAHPFAKPPITERSLVKRIRGHIANGS
ncbi:hypothetical protein ACAN107058_21770 [Paracidovorax anthurii]|uniref:Uncharacterized protein n=1 Tax=Paracidovorax anthurii TaxID=78229 RepID=A0A328ZIC9_9BURK|nr:hypothetical protein AX018_100864 [Paracidovorax anthurii]